MPEIGEIARIVHYLRRNLTSRRISNVLTQEDTIVFNSKVGTTASGFASALKAKKVLDARQQGKYFWLVMESPPHPLFHFGMTGWIRLSNEETSYKSDDAGDGDVKEEHGEKEDDGEEDTKSKAKGKGKGKPKATSSKNPDEWPPRFWKFVLQMEGEPHCEAAFVDARRLARIRLVDCPADEMRNTTPLKENGPDPVIDKDILTVEWLTQKLRGKKVPVKALLLDQANISGVGNWVADEVLYNAKIHPEQYSNTFSDAQIKQLHDSLIYVCTFACDVLSDSRRFPQEWLFKHRWNKGKKGEGNNVLPNGEKIMHITVGGRTSAIVPSVQKKTGPVAGDVDGYEDQEDEAKPKKKVGKGKRKAKNAEDDEDEDEEDEAKPKKKVGKGKRKAMDAEDDEDDGADAEAPSAKGRKGKTQKTEEEADDEVAAAIPAKKKNKASPKRSSKSNTLDAPKAVTGQPTPKSKTKASSNEAVKKQNGDGTPQRRSGRLSRN